jgi:hypothetical protein
MEGEEEGGGTCDKEKILLNSLAFTFNPIGGNSV